MDRPDPLREEYTIDTPENVTFGYDIAGIGSRFIGALIDSILIVLLLLLLNVLLATALAYAVDSGAEGMFGGDEDPGWVAGLVVAIYALLNFAVLWGYYIAFELRWDGRTPGKRVAGTQVVKVDGAPAGFTEVAIRNLVRIVDFLPIAYAIGVITMFLNRQSRRLGDFAAGTLVIKQRNAIRLESLGAAGLRAPSAGAEHALLQFPNLRQLSAADYQVVRDALARHDQGGLTPHLMHRLAVAVAARLQTEAPGRDWTESRQFLQQVADAYRALGQQ
jgi:uncharacterized RDD family membrane protein YckC